MKTTPYIRPKTAVPQFSEENGFYTTEARSFNMSRIKGKDTKPEKLLKKALWHAGIRYKSPKKPLPGKPDISLKKYKLVIFVDGTFWHGYDWEQRKETIKSNREFWIAKIERNMERDREVNAFYQSKGWTVLRFWDFEVEGELGVCIKLVLDVLEGKVASP
ncbi:very short patch repair endonuclease [Algoriphagus sp. D3-2-R+10]|uniref:very short patch repair endonuclease n=1 Tax=Algoriphagus aurantiacus TaxID=3103948 RepID=UPI002B3F8350|nr:very short patch repair endonuclease [Algoriphagus sp. D3-2-R+10]MEB2777471.1 very short patch repair endonuclease [Algoriphagus sp. D3-2-R+10]